MQPNEPEKIADLTDPTVYHDPSADPLPPSLDEIDPVDQDLLGTTIDVYSVRELLGSGAMGRVYLAWHERLHRASALKILTASLVRADPWRLDLFFSEARSAARIQHPAVVTVHSIGSDRGYHFLEMEYVAGASLGRIIRSRGALSPREATRLFAQVATGLAEAHTQGIVHADIKPDNLLLTPTEQVKLADFGLARSLGSDVQKQFHRVGTPRYMAPEVFAGAPPTAASDIYSLGASIYYALTTDSPYPASTLAILESAHAKGPPPRLEEKLPLVPIDLADLVAELLHKDPEKRPKADGNLVRRLEELATRLVPLEEIINAAAEGTPITVTGCDDRFTFEVSLPGQRRQKVEAELDKCVETGESIVNFWTPCAPADPTFHTYVLSLNARLTFGAISLHDHEGQPYFVMLHSLRRDSLDPEEIRSTVQNLARSADVVERLLTGKDRH